MYYSNIPRRKIYEEMLNYEEGLIDLEILLHDQEHWEKNIEKTNKQTIPKMFEKFINIKSLMIMFIENHKYKTEEEFKQELINYNTNQDQTNTSLQENKNLTKNQKETINKLNQTFKEHKKLETKNQAKTLYHTLVEFNDLIPKFLEIRRDHMKK